MDDGNGLAVALAVIALALAVAQAKRIDRLARDMDSLVAGDPETVKLRRKLEGREDG
jgi:HAMP domain-containing protein